MCELCDSIARIVDQVQDFLPRCEKTDKVMFEVNSAPIIAEQMSKRTGENWEAVPCDACSKIHMCNNAH